MSSRRRSSSLSQTLELHRTLTSSITSLLLSLGKAKTSYHVYHQNDERTISNSNSNNMSPSPITEETGREAKHGWTLGRRHNNARRHRCCNRSGNVVQGGTTPRRSVCNHGTGDHRKIFRLYRDFWRSFRGGCTAGGSRRLLPTSSNSSSR